MCKNGFKHSILNTEWDQRVDQPLQRLIVFLPNESEEEKEDEEPWVENLPNSPLSALLNRFLPRKYWIPFIVSIDIFLLLNVALHRYANYSGSAADLLDSLKSPDYRPL